MNKTDTQLVKATIGKMTYDDMVIQLKKVCGGVVPSSDVKIKQEPGNEEIETMYGARRTNHFSSRGGPGRNRCTICESIYHLEKNCPDRSL